MSFQNNDANGGKGQNYRGAGRGAPRRGQRLPDQAAQEQPIQDQELWQPEASQSAFADEPQDAWEEDQDIAGTGDEYLRQWSHRVKESLMRLCPNDFDQDLETFKKELRGIFRTLRHQAPLDDEKEELPEGPSMTDRLRRGATTTAAFIKRTWKDSWCEDCAKGVAQRIVDSCDQEYGLLFRAKKSLSDYAASRKPRPVKTEDNMGDKILAVTKKGSILAFRGIVIGARYVGKVTAHGVTVGTGKLRDKLEEREARRQEAIARGEKIPTLKDRAQELTQKVQKAASDAQKRASVKVQQWSQDIKERTGGEDQAAPWSGLGEKLSGLKDKVAGKVADAEGLGNAKDFFKKAGARAEELTGGLKEKLKKSTAGMAEGGNRWKDKIMGDLSDLTSKVKDSLHRGGQEVQEDLIQEDQGDCQEPIQASPLCDSPDAPQPQEVPQGPVVDVDVEEEQEQR